MCREACGRTAPEEGLPEAPVSPDKDASQFPETDTSANFDTKRSWVICVICTIAVCGSSVGFRCSGLLLVWISEEFGIPKGEAAWPNSIVNLQMYFSGIVIGPLAQRYPLKNMLLVGIILNGLGFAIGAYVPNIQLMTLGYGAVHGFGAGTVLVAVNVLLTQNFDRYRGVAYGIAHASSAVASIIFPSLFEFVTSRYSFRWAMLTVGLILISLAPLALLVTDAPGASDDKSTTGNKTPIFAWSVFREPMFYVILCVNLVFQWSFDIVLATIVDYGSQGGLSAQDVILVLGCYSVCDILGRVGLPTIADSGWIARDTLITVSYFASCAFLVLLCVCRTMTSLIVLILCLGAFFGLSGIYSFSLVARYLGTKRLPFTYGMMGTIGGTVFLLMPPAIGLFRDHFEDYRLLYLLSASLLFVTTIPWLGVIYRRRTGLSLERP